jgi:hypothetical protein
MSSGDLITNDHDQPEPSSNEVQFALVISRMIDTVKNSPEDMRQAVYDLALQEQFTHADARDIRRSQQALETAIRGVEEFSRQQLEIPPPASQIADSSLPRQLAGPEPDPSVQLSVAGRIPVAVAKPGHPLWAPMKRTIGVLLLVGGALVTLQQRERLASLVQYLPEYDR